MTIESIGGYEFEILEVISGNMVRAKHLGKDILAFFMNIFGGEILSTRKVKFNKSLCIA